MSCVKLPAAQNHFSPIMQHFENTDTGSILQYDTIPKNISNVLPTIRMMVHYIVSKLLVISNMEQ